MIYSALTIPESMHMLIRAHHPGVLWQDLVLRHSIMHTRMAANAVGDFNCNKHTDVAVILILLDVTTSDEVNFTFSQ